MKIDLAKFNQLTSQKYLSVQQHPLAPLLIFNYTHKAQFDRAWTEETMMARGLITDLEGNIHARPFRKFFNYEEHVGEDSKLSPLPAEPFTVWEKYDGSLGILYWDAGQPKIATRGSFTSDQAIRATEILHAKYPTWQPDKAKSYLFEIIYPQNKIVVDYQGLSDLILLAVLDTESAEEYEVIGQGYPFPIAKQYEGWSDLTQLKELATDNSEGFVIRFYSGLRLKLKFAEYVRLHRLVTGVNAKRIWEHLKDNLPLDELMERVPDEFLQWVKSTQSKLQTEHDLILHYAQTEFDKLAKLETRRDKAIYIQENLKWQKAVFALLSGKDPSPIIWKMIRPVAERPFREDIDV